MRTPREVWDACASDERWLDDQVALVAEIMREAFAAGHAAGVELVAGAIDGHAAGVASNLATRLPESVGRGMAALAVSVRQLGGNSAAVLHAWHAVVGPKVVPRRPQ